MERVANYYISFFSLPSSQIKCFPFFPPDNKREWEGVY